MCLQVTLGFSPTITTPTPSPIQGSRPVGGHILNAPWVLSLPSVLLLPSGFPSWFCDHPLTGLPSSILFHPCWFLPVHQPEWYWFKREADHSRSCGNLCCAFHRWLGSSLNILLLVLRVQPLALSPYPVSPGHAIFCVCVCFSLQHGCL